MGIAERLVDMRLPEPTDVEKHMTKNIARNLMNRSLHCHGNRSLHCHGNGSLHCHGNGSVHCHGNGSVHCHGKGSVQCHGRQVWRTLAQILPRSTVMIVAG